MKSNIKPNHEKKLVYNSKDLMDLLGIKAELLRKFRNEGYLSYIQYPNSDKIWYSQQNLEDFLNNPIAQHKAFNTLEKNI